MRFIINILIDFRWRAFKTSTNNRTNDATLENKESWIRKRLRATPWWPTGHRELALIALGRQDFELAYASSQAYLKSSSSRSARLSAQMLIAKCYLATFEFERAAGLLEDLLTSSSSSELREELAAAYIGLEKWMEAQEVLTSISQDKITAEGKAALEYCRGKMKG